MIADPSLLPAVSKRTPGCHHIFIDNLIPTATDEIIRERLVHCGNVRGIRRVLDYQGVPMNKVIVELESEMSALMAVSFYHGSYFQGLPMRVDYAPGGTHPDAR